MAQPNFETVVTNGIQLRVALAGKGPLVLLVHGWPGIQRRPLDRFQQLWPSDAELAHDADVEIDDDLPDSRIELEQREEAPVAQARQHVALDDEHSHLDLGLVARLPRPGGQDRRAVVGGKILRGAVDAGLVAAAR